MENSIQINLKEIV